MLIRIYNHAKCRDTMTSALVKDVLEKYYSNRYFLKNEWFNGPSTSIVIDGFNEYPHLQLTKEWVKQYKKAHPISKDNIIDIHNPLEIMQHKLNVSNDVEMKEDGHIEVVERGKGSYHTRHHLNTFDRFRFQLQPIYNEITKVLPTLTIKEKNQLFLDMFVTIANLYNGCIEYGYTSFKVKIDQFFLLSGKKGSNHNIEENFENSRTILFESEQITLPRHAEQLLVKWREEWLTIKYQMSLNFDKNEFFDGATLLELENQFLKVMNELKKKNAYAPCITPEKVQNFTSSTKALVFNNLISLLYLSFPFFENNSIKLHFYTYCTVRLIEESYNNQYLLHNTY